MSSTDKFQLKMLEETLDDKQIKMLERIIATLEESFPVSALYVDLCQREILKKRNRMIRKLSIIYGMNCKYRWNM